MAAVVCALGMLVGMPAAWACGGGYNCSDLGNVTEWQAASGDWLGASNWTLGIPSRLKAARIDNMGTAILDDDGAAKYLQLGFTATGQGILNLTTNADLQVQCGADIGADGSGILSQSGGRFSILAGDLCLGYGYTGLGSYFMNDGVLCTEEGTMLGREGQGAFFQSAGTHRTSHGPVILGRLPGSYGAYSLNGGSVMAACGEVIGWSGEGDFHQYAGTNTAGGTLYLAYDTNATASYYLYDGRLNASKEVVGSGGLATFLQYGGKNDVCGDLDVAAAASPNSSSYSIYSGSLVVDGSETIGSGGNASFYQGGGSQQIGCTLAVGELKDSSGWLGLGGGSVQTRKLSVGAARGSGTLEFDDPSALVSVSDEVTFGSLATLVAVQGSAIHMTDPLAAFLNESTDTVALAGLANLEVIFEGGIEYSYDKGCGGGCQPCGPQPQCNSRPQCGQPAPSCQSQLQWAVYEVSGADLGKVAAGFSGNFVLEKLTVGGSKPAAVKLVDRYDNGNRGTSNHEALYVHNVSVAAGSTLDLSSLKVYADGTVDIQGTVTGGTIK